jgi:5,10-methylene-tetrahydrofolate dehydrogenase/methenyl tetrahydrofolate cyclohydrolase
MDFIRRTSENGIRHDLYSCDTFQILELLERYGVETKGKHTVVIGRSHIVGHNEYFDG